MNQQPTIEFQDGEACIIIGDVDCQHCIEQLFSDAPIHRTAVTRWPQLLKELGVFPSTSDARRNGWDKDIPEGWNEVVIGKLKRTISVWRVTENNPLYAFYKQPHHHAKI